VPSDEVVLNPQQLVEGTHDADLLVDVQRELPEGLEQSVRQQAHQSIHLHQRHIDLLVAGLRGVDFTDGVEIQHHAGVVGAADQLHQVPQEMLLAKLDLSVLRGQLGQRWRWLAREAVLSRHEVASRGIVRQQALIGAFDDGRNAGSEEAGGGMQGGGMQGGGMQGSGG